MLLILRGLYWKYLTARWNGIQLDLFHDKLNENVLSRNSFGYLPFSVYKLWLDKIAVKNWANFL